MKISDHVKISSDFQTSVNIDFDLGKSDKLFEYVPTSDICEILGTYIDSLENNKNQSTFLVGPYGKGKSFLTLALLQLSCGLSSEKASKDFINRVASVDKTLSFEIQSFIKKKRYLPVIVDSDYDNLKQSFMVALKSSLESHGFTDLVPASSFDSCREILKSWREDPVISKGRLAECDKRYDLSLMDDGLKNYSPKAYSSFVDLYNCVTIGQRFNPLVIEDVPRLFSDVSSEIIKKGYSGIIVVFDEFSKFLESKSRKLGEDLKFIQKFAEKANRSDQNYSLYLCCIAHKPITQYDNSNSRISDLLRTVDGRFTTLRFHRGMKENMELISNAILKTNDFDIFYDDFRQKDDWVFDGIDSLKLLDSSIDFDSFSKGCYPLNPLAAYCLVRVSELVAQNERTLFTFLSGSDTFGLRRLINGTDEEMIGVPAIYDYFHEQFQESGDGQIKNICYMADAALDACKGAVAGQIIKSIATIRIINDDSRIRSTKKTISLSIGLPENELEEPTKKLFGLGLIRENLYDGSLDFSFAGGKEINERADRLLNKELRRIDPVESLNKLMSSRFYLPNAYNANKRIVRYCRYCYIDYETFKRIVSFSKMGQLPYDVLILRILGEEIDDKAVREKTNKIGDSKVIVELPGDYNHKNLIKLLRYYSAYQKMMESSVAEDGNEAVSFVISECKQEINNIINDGFGRDNSSLVYCCDLKNKTKAEFIDGVFERLYYKSPLINNEMLNRNVLTPQYRKARNDVVNFLLSYGADSKTWEEKYSGTSAQNTVWRVFVDNIGNKETGIQNIVDVIKGLMSTRDNQVFAKRIVETLSEAPYGVRLGTIPLFIAVCISEMNKMDDSSVTLFFRTKETELNADNIDKAIGDVGEDYRFEIDQGAKKRGDYLALLISLFGGKTQSDASSNVQLALGLMKTWFRNRPQIVRSATKAEYPASLSSEDESLLRELGKYDINPSEFLFSELPSILRKTGFEDTLNELAREKKKLEIMVETIAKNEFVGLDEELGFGHGSLLAGFKGFLLKKEYKPGSLFGNKEYSDLAEYLYSSNSFDDVSLIKEMSRVLLNVYFEDWVSGTKELFITKLKGWIGFINASANKKNRVRQQEAAKAIEKAPSADSVSPMAPLLESKIRDTISQFGQSISESDVVFVLAEILKDTRGDK
jgi:hypothetical protein